MSNKKQQIPAIRFNGFSDAWEQRELGELVSKAIDNRGKTPPTQEKGIHPLLEIASIGGYFPDYSKVCKYVDDDTYNTWFRAHLKENDILFSTVGNTGLATLMDNFEGVTVAQNIVGFRAKKSAVPEFLLQMFKLPSNLKKAKRIEMGAVQPSIKVSQLIHVEYRIPTSKEEQAKIGTFFKQLDETIALHQRQLDNYKELKKAMLQNMFPQEEETIPKVRFDGFTEEWKQCKLKDTVNGDISDGDWIEKEHIHDEGVYRIIQTGNLGVGTYIDKKDTAKFMNQSSFDTLKANEIYPGDILISRLADPAGRTIILPELSDRMVTAVDVTVIRPNENFDADFFVAEMNSGKNLNEVAKQVSGTSHKRISRKNLENVEINVTSLAEQKQIGAFFKTLDDTIVLHQQKISNYQALKSTFLQKMFM